MEILKTIENFDKSKKWDSTFMEMASLFAGHSSCVKRKVGAVLVKDLRTHHDFAEQFEIHAEQNCLSFAAKNGVSTKDCTLYITTAPCVNCAKIIIASGIKKVIYSEIYKNDYGIKLLRAAKINCEKMLY